MSMKNGLFAEIAKNVNDGYSVPFTNIMTRDNTNKKVKISISDVRYVGKLDISIEIESDCNYDK